MDQEHSHRASKANRASRQLMCSSRVLQTISLFWDLGWLTRIQALVQVQARSFGQATHVQALTAFNRYRQPLHGTDQHRSTLAAPYMGQVALGLLMLIKVTSTTALSSHHARQWHNAHKGLITFS